MLSSKGFYLFIYLFILLFFFFFDFFFIPASTNLGLAVATFSEWLSYLE